MQPTGDLSSRPVSVTFMLLKVPHDSTSGRLINLRHGPQTVHQIFSLNYFHAAKNGHISLTALFERQN